MQAGCYVIVDHPYLDPAPVFGPYESRQEAVEDFGGWWKAITAANGQLLEDHEDKIRVIVRGLSPESRVTSGADSTREPLGHVTLTVEGEAAAFAGEAESIPAASSTPPAQMTDIDFDKGT